MPDSTRVQDVNTRDWAVIASTPSRFVVYILLTGDEDPENINDNAHDQPYTTVGPWCKWNRQPSKLNAVAFRLYLASHRLLA